MMSFAPGAGGGVRRHRLGVSTAIALLAAVGSLATAGPALAAGSWVPRPDRGYAIHGSTSVPSYPASHGCVRVTLPAMNRLWSSLRIGMPVHVYR
jgi:lipoprotein-anchoring transpeptidase ErfK/SrfK